MCQICAALRPYDAGCTAQELAGSGIDSLRATITAPQRAALPMVTVDRLAGYLTQGYWQDNGQYGRAFDTRADNVITVDLGGLNGTGRALARDALAAWSSVADLRFQERSGGADIRFGDSASGASALMMVNSRNIVSADLNIDRSWPAGDGGRIGTYSFQVYLHEIGHALGLGHQGNYNGGGSFARNARFGNDSWQASVMSYFSQDENPNIDASHAYAATPMPADIIAIQSLYGAAGAGTLTAGNTTYGVGHTLGNSWLGRLFSAQNGAGHPTVQDARAVAVTIHDAGGFDTLNFANDRQGQRVDLRMGAASDIYGLTGNVQIAHNTLIEGYVAGSGHDVVQGNAAGNMLRGGGGNDRLIGARGNDTLHGGPGHDTLLGGPGTDRLFGHEGNDILTDLTGHTMMRGGPGNDRLTAGNGRDTLYGDLGNDVIVAGGGNDVLFGGPGRDTIRAGSGNDRAEGGAGNDIVDGGPGNDRLFGQQGQDILIGGRGADIMVGGAGADVFRFFSASDSSISAPDLITDFDPDHDVLDLRALDLTPRNLQWDRPGSVTRVWVDTDGDRQPDMLIRLSGRPDLDADAFLL